MRLFLATNSPIRYSPYPRLATTQILCGPLQVDRTVCGRVFSLRSGVGEYEVRPFLERIPAEQAPEVYAVYLDTHTLAFPRGFPQDGRPRVALIGSLVGNNDRLQRVLDYLNAERFDRVVLVESKLDAPLISVATSNPISWYPGLMSQVPPDALPFVRNRTRFPRIAVPRVSWHRYASLNLVAAALLKGDAKVATLPRDPLYALETIAHSSVAVATSETGELPLELFFALASGTPVVGNPALNRTGLGEILVTAGCAGIGNSESETADLAVALVSSPDTAAEMGAAGIRWYDQYLSVNARLDAFERLALRGEETSPFSVAPTGSTFVSFQALRERLPIFSTLQECARASAEPTAFVPPEADASVKLLVERLPRLAVFEQGHPPSGSAWSFFAAAAGTTVHGQPACLWVPPGERVAALGYTRVKDLPGLLFKSQYRAVLDLETAARTALEIADFEKAEVLAQQLMKELPRSPEGHLIAADLAVEKRSEAAFAQHAQVLLTLDPHDVRLEALVQRKTALEFEMGRRQLDATWEKLRSGLYDDAEKYVAFILDKIVSHSADTILQVSLIGAWLKERKGLAADATTHWTDAAKHNPNVPEGWFDLGVNLAALGHDRPALDAFRRACELSPSLEEFRFSYAYVKARVPDMTFPAEERDLLITGAESNMKHGAGILLKRCFSESRDMITLRMGTCFRGVELVGTSNLLSASLPSNEIEVESRIRRLLSPYKIRRIICVPFNRTEFIHAIAARAVTNAPLCTYVMDDRNVYTTSVEDQLILRLIAVSQLRLTISPEMQLTYGLKFHHDFDLLPPVVSDTSSYRENRWTPKKRPATHCAFVGSLWSHEQLVQLSKVFARTGLTADWFGKEKTAECEKMGIHGQGFLPESELADRLTTYPFVVLPSGELNGTEDNEWLTRLSLPSRLVFLLQCGIPILVIASPETCASRFVRSLNIGRVMSSSHPNPLRVVQELTHPTSRAQILANIKAAAPAFVMPNVGEWIWNSLAAGKALPAPFHSHMPAQTELKTLWPAA